MSQFNADAWSSADPNAPMDSNDPPAPGEYDVVINDARAFQSKAGNDVAIVEWQITGGSQTGYSWPDLYGFKNDGQIKAAKAMCDRIGVDVDTVSSLEDLDARLKERIGEYFRIEVVQNGQWLNTYVRGTATQQPLSDVPDDGAFQPVPADDTDIPF